MKQEEFSLLLQKVDELKALFVFSQRTVPFLGDVFNFIQEIVPVLQELRYSMDIASNKIPQAAQHLDKVTHATEMASTEILNILEKVFGTINSLDEKIKQRKQLVDQERKHIVKIDNLLNKLITRNPNDLDLANINALWKEHLQRGNDILPLEDLSKTLDNIRNDSLNIMMALQVQDITAQQIAAVNRLMQAVDQGLTRLMQHFADVKLSRNEDSFNLPHLDISFDHTADYESSSERQKIADEIVNKTILRKNKKKSRKFNNY
jgi:chemotaxis regulatin CheY-phosphate phosphatase CheZ